MADQVRGKASRPRESVRVPAAVFSHKKEQRELSFMSKAKDRP